MDFEFYYCLLFGIYMRSTDMNSTFRKTIAIILSMFILGLIYLGAYLPLRKSVGYIDVHNRLNSIRSLDDFNKLFEPVLNFYSPIGQEELVSAYLGVIVNILNSEPGPNEQAADLLIKKAEYWARPLLLPPGGFSYSQNFLKLGAIYRIGFVKFQNDDYYLKSAELFKEGLVHSPNRPVFLYNLFDLYSAKNDVQNMKWVGEIILKYWPNDESVKKIISNYSN